MKPTFSSAVLIASAAIAPSYLLHSLLTTIDRSPSVEAWAKCFVLVALWATLVGFLRGRNRGLWWFAIEWTAIVAIFHLWVIGTVFAIGGLVVGTLAILAMGTVVKGFLLFLPAVGAWFLAHEL